jgi:hypothetical protein
MYWSLRLRPVISLLSLLVLVVVLRAYFMAFVPDPPPRDVVLADLRLMNVCVEAQVSKRYQRPIQLSWTGHGWIIFSVVVC